MSTSRKYNVTTIDPAEHRRAIFVSTMQYTDLFVDFDDTLYDTHGNAVIALTEVFAHFHLADFISDEAAFYRDYWETNVALWDQYAHGLIERDYLIVERFRHPLALGRGLESKTLPADAATGQFPAATREFCLEVSDYFLSCCATKPGVVEGAHELMDYLRGRGYRLHMTSNGFHEVQYSKLRACGLFDHFDTIVLSEDAGVNKPHADFFRYAFEQSKARPESTLMIGDNIVTDILGAKLAGLPTLYFNRKGEPRPTTVEGHADPVDYEVTSLREIMDIL